MSSGIFLRGRTVQIRLAGYQDWVERVYVESNLDTKIRVTLTPVTTGSVQVSSVPAGANVLINGSPVGITPVTIPELPAGQVEMRLTLPGYQDWTAVTSIIPGQTVPVFGTLVPVVVQTPEPVNTTPVETPIPEPTQSPISLFTAAGALALTSLWLKKDKGSASRAEYLFTYFILLTIFVKHNNLDFIISGCSLNFSNTACITCKILGHF